MLCRPVVAHARVLIAALASGENDVLRVHEALDVLAKADERLAQVVELRYFGGMTEAESAEVLGTSERTVRRDWENPAYCFSRRSNDDDGRFLSPPTYEPCNDA